MKLRLSAVLTTLLLVLIAPLSAQDARDEVALGEIVTIEGEVQEILSPYSFVLERSEPFDFTPSEVVVINDDTEPFAVDVNVGRTVQVTGRVDRLHIDDIVNEIAYEIETTLFGEYDTEDYTLVASLVTDPVDLAVAGDFTFDPDIVIQIETDPTPYLGETFTVEGYVSEILGSDSFRIDEMEPFDLTPGSFVVFNDDTIPFAVDINLGRHVRVTGRLFDFDIETVNTETEYDLVPEPYANYGAGDYAMVAESVIALGARTADTVYIEDTLMSPTMDDLEDNPFDYVGQVVTIEGEVTETYPNSFVLEEDEFFDVYPMRIPVFAGETIIDPDDWTDFFDDELYSVTGEIIVFDELEIGDMIDFVPDPDLYADFDENDIAIVASSVVQVTE